MSTTTPCFVCPACGDQSFVRDRCPRCNIEMVPEGTTPLSAPALERRTEDYWYTSRIVQLRFAGIAAGAAFLLWHGFLTARVVFALVAVILMITLPPLLRRLTRRRALAALAATACTPIEQAREGRVHVRGRSTMLQRAFTPTEQPCLAFEAFYWRIRSSRYYWKRLLATGGMFELEDGSGARARVLAEHVVIAQGVQHGDELLIPLDAEVEVLGNGRWSLAPESQSTDYRGAARVLEISGTRAQPVVLRLVAPRASEAPAGTRVALERAPAVVPAAIAAAEPPPPARHAR